jgi:hypothetical protein
VQRRFVLDAKGYKMSKSLGNVVDPRLVIDGGKDLKAQPAYGADTLRMWVASVDYTSDVLIGDGIIKQTFDVYRKVRRERGGFLKWALTLEPPRWGGGRAQRRSSGLSNGETRSSCCEPASKNTCFLARLDSERCSQAGPEPAVEE